MHTALHTTFATTSSIPATSSSSATSSSWNRNPYVPSDFATSGSNRSTSKYMLIINELIYSLFDDERLSS